jgi:hypothetical protein
MCFTSTSLGDPPAAPPAPASPRKIDSLNDLLFLDNPNATFSIAARTEDGRLGYIDGERFRLRIAATEECYLFVMAFGPDGTFEQIAPAKAITGSTDPVKLKAGEVLLLPRGQSAFKAMPPHGETTFRVFATKNPVVLPLEGKGTKGVGVADGPASPFDGIDWAETTVLVMTGESRKDLAERMGVSEEEATKPAREQAAQPEKPDAPTEYELPELPELPLELPETLPKLERPRPARKNPNPPLKPTASEASESYRKQWETLVSGEASQKSIGSGLKPALPARRSMPRLAAEEGDLLVVRKAAEGTKAVGAPRYTTERVPLVPPGSKAIGASPEETLRRRVAEIRKADPSIVTIVPNRPISIFRDDPEPSVFTGLQWHLHNQSSIGQDIRWLHRVLDIMELHPVPIGMVDQGVHVADDRLKPLIAVNAGEVADNGKDDDGNGLVDDVYGWNFASNSGVLATADDRFNHGSYCTSIIGGASSPSRFAFFPVAYAPKVIESACMAWDDAAGTANGSTDTLLKAIEYAADRGAKVINLSLGGATTPLDLLLLERHPLFLKLASRDVLLVIAAGNENIDIDEHPVSPACLNIPNSIVVMATDPDGQPARDYDPASGEWKQYSNWGRNSVHIAAPGTMILGIPSVGSTSYGNGTSYATPIVTAAAALLWSQHPSWDVATLKRAILETARPVEGLEDKCVTGGILDLDAALNWTP